MGIIDTTEDEGIPRAMPRGRLRHEVASDEALDRRIAMYESVQRKACAIAGADYIPPDYSKLVWLGPGVAGGHRRIYGERRRATRDWSGWSFARDGESPPAPERIQFEHLRHLVTMREDLTPYLGLPPGWAFAILPDGTWRAWSPQVRIVDWVDELLQEPSPNAESIERVLDLVREIPTYEHMPRVAELLESWIASARLAGEFPGDVRDSLASALSLLRRDSPPA